jgi:hypothetical protein
LVLARARNCLRLFIRLLPGCNKYALHCVAVGARAAHRGRRRCSQQEDGREMVRISVQVSSGTARFRVMVQAVSIERALEIARRHNPAAECQVSFPIDPEAFFAKNSSPGVETVEEAA